MVANLLPLRNQAAILVDRWQVRSRARAKASSPVRRGFETCVVGPRKSYPEDSRVVP